MPAAAASANDKTITATGVKPQTKNIRAAQRNNRRPAGKQSNGIAAIMMGIAPLARID